MADVLACTACGTGVLRGIVARRVDKLGRRLGTLAHWVVACRRVDGEARLGAAAAVLVQG